VVSRPVSREAVENRRDKSTQIETDGEKLKVRSREWLRYQDPGKTSKGTIVMADSK